MLPRPAFAQETAESAVEIARDNRRVQEFVEQHAETRLEAHFNDQFQVWIIELFNDGGKLGLVSVRNGEVVEVDLGNGGRERDSARELIENDVRIRELREQFPEAQLEIGRSDDAETRPFELIVNKREVAAGLVNLETGRVQFYDDMPTNNEKVEDSGGFIKALLRAVAFPQEGPGLFWLSAAVTLLVIFPFRKPLSLQSVDVIALLAIYPLSSVVWGHKWLTYIALFAVTSYFSLRCLLQASAIRRRVEPTTLPVAALVTFLAIAAVAHVQTVATRGPDDSGIWSVFGGQYLWQTGRFPYGQVGGGGTYGPLLYAIHAPVAHFLPPVAHSDDGATIVADRSNFVQVGYQNVNFRPAKVVMLLFDLMLIWSLFAIGRQLQSPQLGVVLALLYAVNAITIQRDLLFISHIAPTACVVAAIACRHHPVSSGFLLGCGASILFWPAFLIPLWLGYFGSRGLKPLIRGGAAIAAVGVLTLSAIWLLTEPVEQKGSIRVFLDNTWTHQEGGGNYSHSPFGFWGQWIEREPERIEQIDRIKSAVRWAYFALCLLPLLYVFRSRPMQPTTLIALSAFYALGLQFWKTHGGGLYTGWYLPLVIAALFSFCDLEEPEGRIAERRDDDPVMA